MYKVGDEVYLPLKIVKAYTESGEYVAELKNKETRVYTDKYLTECAEKTYTQGLSDAWELAKKILNMKMDVAVEVFDCTRISDVMEKFTPEEALAKIEAYEKEKEIKVGDVMLHDGDKGIVTCSTHNCVYILWFDGSSGTYEPNELKKTDLHIDIEDLLRQIGE